MQTHRMPEENSGLFRIFVLMAEAMTLHPSQSAPQNRPVTERPAKPTAQIDSRPGLLDRLDQWFWTQRQSAVEAYLATSADIHELEARMRNLERGPEFLRY